MYKTIIEVPGKLWVVVNTQNVRERYEFTAVILANCYRDTLNKQK